MRRVWPAVATALGALVTPAPGGGPGEITVGFYEVVDSQTFIPFTPPLNEFTVPANSNGFVAFRGAGGAYEGIFHNNAQSFTKLADSDTAVPGGTGAFSVLGPPSFDALRAAFLGRDASFLPGVYAGFAGPAPARVVGSGGPVPVIGGTFLDFFDPVIDFDPGADEGHVVFLATTSDFIPVIVVHGAFHDESLLVAAGGDAMPNGGGAVFTSFSDPAIDGGVVAFRGDDVLSSFSGIYSWTAGGGLEVVADETTMIPDGSGAFTGFASPFLSKVIATDDGDVAFRGDGSGGLRGVYARIDGILRRIADTATAAPGGGTFTAFFDVPPSIDAGRVAFQAVADGNNGLYLWDNGTIHRIIAAGDQLDGATVLSVVTGPQALSGDTIAFRALLEGGAQAVYLAVVDVVPPNEADTTGDGEVDVDDLVTIITSWGPCADPDDCPADVNGDGEVDVDDLLAVLLNWGAGAGPPPNDHCGGAIEITGPGAIPFSTVGATSSSSDYIVPSGDEPGFPTWWNLDCDEGSGYELANDVWFRFTVQTGGELQISTTGFDSRVVVYRRSSATCDPGTFEGVMCNDDAPSASTSSRLSLWTIGSQDPGVFAVAEGDELLIRMGSRDPGVTGTGSLLLSTTPFVEWAGRTPESCFPVLIYDPLDPGTFVGEQAFEVATLTATEFTPNCGVDDNVDLWFCFISPNTGVYRAAASGSWLVGQEGPLTVAVYDRYGELLACQEDVDGDVYFSSFEFEARVFWPAVVGQQYLIRVGGPAELLDFYNVTQVRVEAMDSDACGWLFAGPCTVSNAPLAGCDDGQCCRAVCNEDPYCCNVEWDALCVDHAAKLCDPDPGPACELPGEHSCYAADPQSGCDDPECCEAVCQIDPFCCDFEWDGSCVDIAVQVCDPPPCPSVVDHPCDVTSPIGGCEDEACCGIVCDVDPSCCDMDWDTACVQLAELLCQ